MGLSVLSAQDAGISDSDPAATSEAGVSPLIRPILPVDQPPRSTAGMPRPAETVNWNALFLQSGAFLGIQHGVRIATEPGTREGMRGPFFGNYARSVGNMHGWADGDEFYVNYIGHPIQGSVSGYLFTQNDKARFKYVEFGRDRDYWKSRLRAFTFSAFYSAHFEIGLASEASIGSIQSRMPQQGFADLVITPVFGT